MADQWTGLSPYLDTQQPQVPQVPQMPVVSREQKISEVYKKAAEMAITGGNTELGNGLLRMADHIYKPSSSGSDEGLYAKHIDMPGPTGKVHRFLYDPTTKGYTRDIGPVPSESFKAKNVIGRGGISKRPVFQDSTTGRLMYADTPEGQQEMVPQDDSHVLRPTTARGLEAQQVSELAGLKNSYDRLNDVAIRAEKAKDKFGPISGRWEKLKLKFMADGDTQYAVNEIASMITLAYGLSGKQISVQELEMLKSAMLPQLEQPYANFQQTLKFAKDWVAKTHDDRVDYFEKNYFDTNTPKINRYEQSAPSPGQKKSSGGPIENDPLGIRRK